MRAPPRGGSRCAVGGGALLARADAHAHARSDADGNGTLEPGEVIAGLERFGEEGFANMLLQKLDANSDGKVTFAEFVQGWDAIFENTPEMAYALEEEGTIEEDIGA